MKDQQITKNQLPTGSESLWVKKCIRTFSGKYINVFDPSPDDIVIEDIAHALSNQPRFGGHLPEFYSVCQHSIHCCDLASEENQFTALMHDASEAYLLDMPKPIKLEMTQYNRIEDKLMKVIAIKFGFKYPKPEEVDQIDYFMLEREWNVLMLREKSLKYYAPIDIMSHEKAKEIFLEKFNYCKK